LVRLNLLKLRRWLDEILFILLDLKLLGCSYAQIFLKLAILNLFLRLASKLPASRGVAVSLRSYVSSGFRPLTSIYLLVALEHVVAHRPPILDKSGIVLFGPWQAVKVWRRLTHISLDA